MLQNGALFAPGLPAPSTIAGATLVNGQQADSNAFYFAGGDYKLTKDLTAQYYYGNLDDFYTQHFLGLTHNLALGAGVLAGSAGDGGAHAGQVGRHQSGLATLAPARRRPL